MGDTFNLSNNINKKNAIHEFIKDTESNEKSQVSTFLLAIRNIVNPTLIFYTKKQKIPAQDKLTLF